MSEASLYGIFGGRSDTCSGFLLRTSVFSSVSLHTYAPYSSITNDTMLTRELVVPLSNTLTENTCLHYYKDQSDNAL